LQVDRGGRPYYHDTALVDVQFYRFRKK